MDYYDLGETTEAKFIKRLNRFVATVELNGNLTEVHVANTGRMGELLYNGAPLAINSPLLLKRSSGGQETLPLTARYYQTLTSVESGSANATATLNLTYQ